MDAANIGQAFCPRAGEDGSRDERGSFFLVGPAKDVAPADGDADLLKLTTLFEIGGEIGGLGVGGIGTGKDKGEPEGFELGRGYTFEMKDGIGPADGIDAL